MKRASLLSGGVGLSNLENRFLELLQSGQVVSTSSLQRKVACANTSSTATSLNRKLAAAMDDRRVVHGTWFSTTNGAAIRGWRLVNAKEAA
jgi:hypothetical protein